MKLYPAYVRPSTVYTLPGLVSHFVEDPHSLLSPLVCLLQPLFMCPPAQGRWNGCGYEYLLEA